MRFRDMNIKLIYDTSQTSIIDELIVPLLNNSKTYYRGVGYFSSAWIKLVTKGLRGIVENGGKIHILTSPQLSHEYWDAIINGEKAKVDDVLYRSIKSTIDKDFDVVTKRESLNLFSWLIADDIINLKFVVCKNILGNYHDKIAIFEDFYGDRVCLHGSLNDSLQSTYNGESVSVFRSWISGQEDYLNEHYSNFMRLSNGENAFFKIYGVPEMLKEEFRKYQVGTRPYHLPKETKKKIKLPGYISNLNNYQEEAIGKLIDNDWKGIFEMATGTGKTITAIEAARSYYDANTKLALIIVVPFAHLITQWEKVLKDFGFWNVICCYKSTKIWFDSANRNLKNYNAGLQDILCFVTTYKTASSDEFISLVSKVRKHAFLIADECHYIGSGKYSKIMLESINNRLGLSATPDRWFDDDGTKRLRSYFHGTVFEYGLKEAILNNYLTRYEYVPVVVHLDSEELEEYVNLTKKISKLRCLNDEVERGSTLERLLIKRSLLISKASSKKNKLIELLKKQREDGDVSHTLVYCAAGENKDTIKSISDLNIKVHDFVYDVPEKDREEILNMFDKGDIEILVAIKCLDEGVDIPSTQTAYFLASTSNPREFVQRRGRILRKYKDKRKARIFDFLVLPPLNLDFQDESYEKAYRSLIFREIPRFAEFADNAENKYFARESIRPYLKEFDLEYLMDMLPHEIYNELKTFSGDNS